MAIATRDDTSGLAAIGAIALIPLVVAVGLAGTAWETWVALKVWAWYAPWPFPATFVAAVGMNMAVSLVIRQPRVNDERTSSEVASAFLVHGVCLPAMTLAAAWMLRWCL